MYKMPMLVVDFGYGGQGERAARLLWIQIDPEKPFMVDKEKKYSVIHTKGVCWCMLIPIDLKMTNSW